MTSSKAIQKSVKTIAKNKEQYKKQTARKLRNRIKKAHEVLEETDNIVRELSINITTQKQYNSSKISSELDKMLERLDKKGNLTYTQFVRLKDLSSKSFYAKNILLQMQVPDTARYFGTDVELTKTQWVKLSDAQKIARKDYNISANKTKKELTNREKAIFQQYSQSYNTIANITNAIDMSDIDATAIPQTEEAVIKMLKARRGTSQLDLSFGGHSSLLNDLAYTAKAKGDIGRDFVDWIRALMEKDKVIFAKIEKWYQSPVGRDVRQAINNATGDNWYENFKEFSLMIEKVITELQIELDLAPDSFSDQIMAEAEQRIAGYADGYAT